MNDTDGIRRLMMAVERLEDAADKQARQMADGLQQAQQVNAGLATVREAEEAKLKQAMVRLLPNSPGVYRMLGVKAHYDYLEKFAPGKDPATMITSGTSSDEYANRDGVTRTRALVNEMPYFYDPRIEDTGVEWLRSVPERHLEVVSELGEM